jgi:hypothetical protein
VLPAGDCACGGRRACASSRGTPARGKRRSVTAYHRVDLSTSRVEAMKMPRWFLLLLPAVLAVVVSAPRAEGVVQEVEHKASEVLTKTDRAIRHGARKAGEGINTGTRKTGEVVHKGARKIGLPPARAGSAPASR